MSRFDRHYWAERWKARQTGWDIGNVSDPFVEFFDSLSDQNLKILIPGGGNGYEGEYLWKKGFRNVHILDIVQQPLINLKGRVPDFPEEQLLCADFFTLNERFDLVIEQTFFCALDPELRSSYVKKMHEIITPGGKLAGLLFNFPLTEEGPPFGGSEQAYLELFSPYFSIQRMSVAENSIAPRKGRELWFEMTRK
jgi:thiopurine S-methyltransferase